MKAKTRDQNTTQKTFVKKLAKNWYRIRSNKFIFGPQNTRIVCQPRHSDTSAFVAGNHRFIYKSCELLSLEDDSDAKIQDLNDVLYAHAMYPSSGPAWNLLYSVVAYQPEDFVCPICLFPPTAPRITKCGHIFCMDCVKEHFKVNPPAFCPVCYEELPEQSLIRVDLRVYKKSQQTKFTKIMRNTNNCCSFPATWNSDTLPTAGSPDSLFCHFSIVDRVYAQKLLEEEARQIRDAIQEYERYGEMGRIKDLRSQLDAVMSEALPSEELEVFYMQPFKEERASFMYQSEDGQAIFLDELTMQMLKSEFGSIKKAPNVIEAPRLSSYSLRVTRTFRKRYPKLGHLSSGAAVTFELLDLSSIVSGDCIARFIDRIESRMTIDEGVEEVEQMLPQPKLEVESFPSLGKTATQHVHNVKSQWKSLTADLGVAGDFPSLGGSTPSGPIARGTTVWGRIGGQASNGRAHSKGTSATPHGDDQWPSLGHK